MMPTPVAQATDCRNGFHAHVERNAKAQLGEALVRKHFELASLSKPGGESPSGKLRFLGFPALGLGRHGVHRALRGQPLRSPFADLL